MTDSTLQDETVQLDGHEFIRCKFVRCVLVYSGGRPPKITGCSFDAATRFQFSGAAGDTIGFMIGMYHGGFKALIEKTFDSIRNNTHVTGGGGAIH
jgi:hypothetical protein